MAENEMTLATIKVTPDVWRRLKDTADAEGRKMYALASDLIRKGLDGRLVADEREPREANDGAE